MARRKTTNQVTATALVIECVDRTCTVVTGGLTRNCLSLHEAMRIVEQTTPRVAWRQTAPGLWVARTH